MGDCMSKLEVREIGPISGETDVTLGQSGGTVTCCGVWHNKSSF